MKVYVGIDPGKTGAWALIYPGGAVNVFDAEKCAIGTLSKWFSFAMGENTFFVLIEKVQVMPGTRRARLIRARMDNLPEGSEVEVGQGKVGILNYGIGYGKYLGLLEALHIPYDTVHPATWKKMFQLIGKDKTASIERARQLFPQSVHLLTRKKDHGRAEAMLIAEYAMRMNM